MQVNMHEAKSQLSKLVKAAIDGEEVIIARDGEPVVQLTKYTTVKPKRKPGSLKGQIWMADDSDSPETSRMINQMMLSSKVFPDEPAPNSAREPHTAYEITSKRRTKPPAVKRRR